MSIKLDQPITIDQLEATGAVYGALFKLAQQYNISEPYKLISEMKYQIEYHLDELPKTDAPVKPKPKAEGDDKPLDLSEIPF